MKNFSLTTLLTVSVAFSYAQTLTLQPDGTTGKDAYLHSINASQNYGTIAEMNALAWTVSGSPVTTRGIIQFDLTTIPSGSVINSATLYLYHNPTSSNANAQHQSSSGSNEGVVKRIITSWDESTVTWNTQPNVTDVNQVTIPQSSSPTQDYTLDVTALVQDMVNNPATSYGFQIRLVTESYYRSLIFASSDHTDPTNHPKLVVNYTDVTGIEEIQNSPKELIRITDLTGREVPFATNTPLLYIYSDGTVERIFRIEE
jgi:hypothetical protein